jgi:hypothetical protein
MCFPIRRRGTAIVGVISVLALAALPRNASAGIVQPTEAQAAPATPPPQAVPAHQTSISLPAPVAPAASDARQFWYPGIDDGAAIDSITLSNVPVQTTGLSDTATLAGAQQHPLIPLPIPAWTGMAGLLGLAAVKVARNYRKLLT